MPSTGLLSYAFFLKGSFFHTVRLIYEAYTTFLNTKIGWHRMGKILFGDIYILKKKTYHIR